MSDEAFLISCALAFSVWLNIALIEEVLKRGKKLKVWSDNHYYKANFDPVANQIQSAFEDGF